MAQYMDEKGGEKAVLLIPLFPLEVGREGLGTYHALYVHESLVFSRLGPSLSFTAESKESWEYEEKCHLCPEKALSMPHLPGSEMMTNSSF